MRREVDRTRRVSVEDGKSCLQYFPDRKVAVRKPPRPEESGELLRPAQEALGYFFNADAAATRELLEGLLANKARYGYMSCPCSLAAGGRERDRDILCPCVYRAPDVAAYGSCYCGLYVSPAWNAGEIPLRRVPERRPPEKNR